MIVLTGASGQLGAAFRRLLGNEARYLARNDLDLMNPGSIRRMLEDLRPSILINCAAYTAVDRAESEPDIAAAVNTTAVAAMAEATADLGVRLATFSTDYVFDGTSERPYVESDPTRPINTYGVTKRAGEVAALAAYPESLVIRTSWLMSGTHPNFATAMIRLARQGEVAVVNDQSGRPTLVSDLVPATLAALNAGATGVLHLANTGVTSRFELAQQIVELAGLRRDRIRPCATSDYPTAAMRPANSILDSERLDRLGLDPMRSYRPGLQKAVSEILNGIP